MGGVISAKIQAALKTFGWLFFFFFFFFYSCEIFIKIKYAIVQVNACKKQQIIVKINTHN